MAEEYLMVKPEEFQRLIQYYKGQITDKCRGANYCKQSKGA